MISACNGGFTAELGSLYFIYETSIGIPDSLASYRSDVSGTLVMYDLCIRAVCRHVFTTSDGEDFTLNSVLSILYGARDLRISPSTDPSTNLPP